MPIETFVTDRFVAHDWRPLIGEPVKRRMLTSALADMLTPAVLVHLPPSLRLGDGTDAVSDWIDARDAESRVLIVASRADNRLIGLIILARVAGADTAGDVHIGYLFSERVWGQGAATEVLEGLVAALKADAPLRLIGGVDRANAASVRVLEKAGFHRDDGLSDAATDIYIRDIR